MDFYEPDAIAALDTGTLVKLSRDAERARDMIEMCWAMTVLPTSRKEGHAEWVVDAMPKPTAAPEWLQEILRMAAQALSVPPLDSDDEKAVEVAYLAFTEQQKKARWALLERNEWDALTRGGAVATAKKGRRLF